MNPMTPEEKKLLYILELRFLGIWARAWGKGDSRTMFCGATHEEARDSFLKAKGAWLDFVHSIGAELIEYKDVTNRIFVPDPYSMRGREVLSCNDPSYPGIWKLSSPKEHLWLAVPRELALRILVLGELP